MVNIHPSSIIDEGAKIGADCSIGQNVFVGNKAIICDPVGFLDVVALESKASAIITDSGGVQKEAYFHHTPCITLRTETEWTELVEHGFNRLFPPVESNPIALHAAYQQMLSKPLRFEQQLYGDGNAAKLIVQEFKHFLLENKR